jgi:Peptidase family M41
VGSKVLSRVTMGMRTRRISIIPRGIGSLGYTIQRPTEDRFLMTEEELENRMAVLLGGRAAEYIFFHHLSTGAADDLVKATDTARSMVLRYGMDKNLGHVSYERERPPMLGTPVPQNVYAREFSDETERLMDHAVRGLVGPAFDRAIEILKAHRAVHEKTALVLLQKETLEEEDIAALRARIVPAGRRRGDGRQRRCGCGCALTVGGCAMTSPEHKVTKMFEAAALFHSTVERGCNDQPYGGMSLLASTGGVTLLPSYAENMLIPSVVARPLQGKPPTIDLVMGFSKSNLSPLLKRCIWRSGDMVAAVKKQRGLTHAARP